MPVLSAVYLRALFRGGTEEEEMAGALLVARALDDLSTVAEFAKAFAGKKG